MGKKDSPREDPIPGRVLDEEKNNYIGGKSPDRTLLEDEDGEENGPEEASINSRKNGTTNLLYYTVQHLHKFPFHTGNYSDNEDSLKGDIVPVLRELLKPQRWAMLKYYFIHGAATIWILRYNLGMSKTRAYEWHKLIEESGLVEIKTIISPIGKMKKPASIWGFTEATEAQINNTYHYHIKLTSPIYRKADKIAKKYLQEGKTAKTDIGELIRYLKEINEPPRMRKDLARMMIYSFTREEKVHAFTDQSRRDENLRRVLEIIQPPLTQLSPLYETLNSLDINNPDERAAIRDYFVNASIARKEE